MWLDELFDVTCFVSPWKVKQKKKKTGVAAYIANSTDHQRTFPIVVMQK